MKEISIRTVLAFREMRQGYTAINTFCHLMNMPPGMTKRA
jgi:hypothetical protein